MQETRDRVKEVIVEALMLEKPAAEIGDDDDLSETLGVDSVGFLEILSALEDEFGFEIASSEVTRTRSGTVHRLAEIVTAASSSDGGAEAKP